MLQCDARGVFGLLLLTAAACGRADVFFEEPFGPGGVSAEWSACCYTTLTVTEASVERIVAPEGGGQFGKLTSTGIPYSTSGGSVGVGPSIGPMLPYTRGSYTVETEFYLPAAVAETTAVVYLVFYNRYRDYTGHLNIYSSPAQRVELRITAVGGNPDHRKTWEAGSDYAPLTHEAWQHVALVLRGSTAEIRLNGSLLGRTDWLEQPTSGGACGLGQYYQGPPGTSVDSYSSYFDSFRITPATTGAQDWALLE